MQRKLVALILIGIIAATGLYAAARSRAVLAMAEGTLAGELTRSLGSAVQIADVQINSLHSVVLHNISIYDKQGRLSGHAQNARVLFSLFDVIRGKQPVEAIREIVLEAPELTLIQATDGRWNIEDLFERREQESASFSGVIRLEDAALSVATPRGNWQAAAIAGTLDFRQAPWISLILTGQYHDRGVGVTGKVNSDGNGTVTVKAEALDTKELTAWLPAGANCELQEGVLQDLEVTLSKDQDRLKAAGEAKASGVAIDTGKYKLRQGQGRIVFTNDSVYLFGASALLDDQPLTANGKIAISGSEPVFNLKITSAGFDPVVLWPQSPLHGKVAFNADVKGTMARPVISAELALKAGDYSGQELTDAKAKAKLTGSQLTIIELKAGIYGGQVEAAGSVDLNNERYQLDVRGTGIGASALNLIAGLSGAVDLEAKVAGQGPLEQTTMQGTASVAAGTWRGIAFQDAAIGFTKSGTQITLDYVAAKAGGGTLNGRGSIQDGRLNIHLLGHGLPLTALNQLSPNLVLDGLISFEGDLTGSANRPEFKAQFSAVNGTIFKQPFVKAGGAVAINPDALTLSAVEIKDRTGSHRLEGTVSLSANPALDLAIITSGVRAENIIQLVAPGEQLTGYVDNVVTIRGRADKPVVSGRFKLTEGSFRGYLIASGEGSYEQAAGVTRIRDVIVRSLNAQIVMAGVISADHEIDMDVMAQNVDLASLHVSYPYPVTGLANLTGKLSGAADNIVFSGELNAVNLKLNGQALDKVSGSFIIDGSEIRIPSFGFSQGAGRYSFTGNIDMAAQKLFGGIDVENGELAPLLAMLNIPAQDIEGRLNGHISVNGLLKRPNVWLSGSLTAGKLKGYPLDSINMDVAMENNIITVNKFLAKQGAGILAVQGTADLDGQVNLEVGGRDIDAGLLTVWFDRTLDTRGKLNFAAQMTGTAKDPHTAVSLEIKGGGVMSATFDSLYGLFIVDKGAIHVNQLLLSKGSYRASAYGLIPLAALHKEGRKNATIADQMDLRVRLDQADLSILPLLTQEVTAASGKTEGEMLITGTLAQPYIHGSIKVNNGLVKLRSLADPIQKMAIDIQFEGDRITVKSFDGQSGGGSYRLAGSATLKGLALEDYQVLLSLDKLGINYKYFKGPVTGTLTVNQTAGMPKLSGKLLFENDVIDIPYIPELGSSDLNIALDLELQAGNRVRLYNAFLYDLMATGRVKFGGTTKQPAVSGRIEATRGTVSYLRTQFKISEGRADFTQFGSFEPVITLSADSRLETTTVNLKVHGPISTMEAKLTSEPAMSQQEILSLLTLRSSYFEKQKAGSGVAHDTGLSRDEVMSLLDAGLQMRFVSELEESFRRAFGLDGFKLIKGTLSDPTVSGSASSKKSSAIDSAADRETVGDREVYNVEVSKYVTDRLMLSYTFGIDHKEYSAAFRYDITRRISLTGSIDEYNRRRFGLETRFRF